MILRWQILIAIAVLIGCSRSNNPLVGDWKADSGVILEFRDDGRFKFGSRKYPATGTYTATTNRVLLHLEGDPSGAFGAMEWRIAFTNDVLYVTELNEKITAFKRIKLL